MKKTWKRTITTVLAFALAAGTVIGGTNFSEVSAAEQPVAAFRSADEPAEMAVDAGVYEANAGDTIKVKIKAADIKESFNAVNAYLKVNTDAFSILSVTPGDTDDPDNETTAIYKNTTVAQYSEDENTETVAFVYCDLVALKDDVVLVTVELKVNDDTKDGCYAFPFDLRDGSASASRIAETEYGWGDVLSVNPDFRAALITVGAGSDEVIFPEEDEEEQPEEYNNEETEYLLPIIIPECTYAETGQPITTACSADETPAFVVDAGVYEAKAGDTVKIKIRATDIKESFCSVIGYLIIDKDRFTVSGIEPGDADDPDREINEMELSTAMVDYNMDPNYTNASFIYFNTDFENTDEEMVFATIELKVNEDLEDGSYELPFAVLEYGGMATRFGEDRWTDDAIEPEYHGALIKVDSASETISEETDPQTEVPEIEEPQNNEETVSEDHHHNHHGWNGHGHGHNYGHGCGYGYGYGHSYGKTFGQKIAEDISNVISDITRLIFSWF